MDLTVKQESFAQAYIETGNASEAYRRAYNADKMKPETVHRKASELLADGKITARIEQLKAEHAKRHNITVDDLLNELEEARTMAKEKENPNAMVTATMGKAKLLGMDKQNIEVKGEVEIQPFEEWVKEMTEKRNAESKRFYQHSNQATNSNPDAFDEWVSSHQKGNTR